MPAVTPQYLMDFETRMQLITEREYTRLTQNLWWPKVTKVKQSTNRRELFTWLLSTATIHDQGDGGNIRFDDIVSSFTELENKDSGAGLKLRKQQIEDSDGNGPDLAAQWSADIGAYMSYWPQKQTVALLKNGHDVTKVRAYDGKALFATDHPVNPYRTGSGTFSNLITAGSPAAYPIDDSVALDVAFANLGKIFAYIASVRMPNGEDPRFLRPAAILAPPRLFARVVQLMSAKFIAPAGAGGSHDVDGLMKLLGYATPIMADELAGFEDDKTFFIVAEQLATSQLGAIVYSDREPYSIAYYGPQTDAELSRSQQFEWHCHGRNVAAPGHPFLIFKVKGA
jgi:phage major head subunit gpT-like protein